MNPNKYLIKPIEHTLVKPPKIKNSFQLRHDYKKRRREQLWRQNPHCHWCGRLTRLEQQGEYKKKEFHDDIATLDHLVSKLEIPYGTVRPNLYKKAQTMVLACWKCNNDRNHEVAKNLKENNPERLWVAARNNKPNWFKHFYRKYIRRNYRYFKSLTRSN